MSDPIKIYFAGDLFDHKDLVGNVLLGSYIDKESNGRYKCVLPQDQETASNRAEDIRNEDLKQVLECDVALFNFDGTELDSGTVVEYMYAKFLDKPAVILRTDFRASGDQEGGDPWNLMCSFYPRTKVVKLNGMNEYHRARTSASSASELIEGLYSDLALKITSAFDEVCSEESVFDQTGVDRGEIEKWARIFPGKGFQKLFNQ